MGKPDENYFTPMEPALSLGQFLSGFSFPLVMSLFLKIPLLSQGFFVFVFSDYVSSYRGDVNFCCCCFLLLIMYAFMDDNSESKMGFYCSSFYSSNSLVKKNVVVFEWSIAKW